MDWNRAEFGGIFNYTQKFVSMVRRDGRGGECIVAIKHGRYNNKIVKHFIHLILNLRTRKMFACFFDTILSARPSPQKYYQ